MNSIKSQVFDALKDLAKAYGKDSITQERLEIYTNVLVNELSVSELRKSFSKILIECKFFPSIAEIVELAKPKTNTQDEAVLIANKILECGRSYSFHDLKGAKEFLGEYFEIAERFGWRNLLELQNSEINSARAQLRELAKAHLNFQLRSTEVTAPLLTPLGDTLFIERGE